MFENLLIELDMLNHYYSNSFIKFMNNVIYFFFANCYVSKYKILFIICHLAKKTSIASNDFFKISSTLIK